MFLISPAGEGEGEEEDGGEVEGGSDGADSDGEQASSDEEDAAGGGGGVPVEEEDEGQFEAWLRTEVQGLGFRTMTLNPKPSTLRLRL
jgi:hypothetical protein